MSPARGADLADLVRQVTRPAAVYAFTVWQNIRRYVGRPADPGVGKNGGARAGADPVWLTDVSHDAPVVITGPKDRHTAGPQEPVRRLGLHVTDQELAIWRERAEVGPYRSAGDSIANSPGDWDRITRHAKDYIREPHSARWAGPTHGTGCIINSHNWPRDRTGAPPRQGGPEKLRDAAFYAMVAEPPGTEAIAQSVRDELLWHTAQPALDFTNTDRYCLNRFGRGYHPAFQISAWLRKLMYAFDYSRIACPDVWSEADQAQFLAWLEAAARWYLPQIDASRGGMWGRDGSPSRMAQRWGGMHARPIWAYGPVTRKVQHRYNNHVNRYVVFVTDVGILTKNAVMKEYGRRWIREFLQVCVYPEGGISDFYRWDDRRRGHLQGLKYGTCMVGATMIIADHLARNGDPSGYRYATTSGTPDTAGEVPKDGVTTGGPKTLLASARQAIRYTDEESFPVRYACLACSDPRRRIASRDVIRGFGRVDDWYLLQGNVFYRDPYIRSVYMRSLPGTPQLPEQPKHGLGWAENGDAGTFPGVNFMFAQMEGKVWPYPASCRQ